MMKTMIHALLLCAATLPAVAPAMARQPAAQTTADPALEKRVVPLEQGSNFRDLGGYRGAGGKTVRWGRLYRSGGTPMLTDADVARVKALGITQMVDLRSSEERVLAPTRLDGIGYSAVGYSMKSLMGTGGVPKAEQIYRNFPTLLAPQIRTLFKQLAQNDKATVFNCSAGQDRTGFTAAVVLSALGVSRADVTKDYLLSTQLRRTAFEMPRIDAAKHADNPTALMFARWQQPPYDKATPLYDEGGAYIRYSLDEIEKRWGSVEGYLRKEFGINDVELALIRRAYLS